MANLNFNSDEWKIKYGPYDTNMEISHCHISPFPAPVEDVFLNLSANNPVVDSWNQSDI